MVLGYLPRLLHGDPAELKRFEEVYEKIGIPSLLLALATAHTWAYTGLRRSSGWPSRAKPGY
jgi:hypothetical protein